MGYSKEIFQAANKKLLTFRQIAEQDAENKKNDLFKRSPRAKQIIQLLNSTPAQIAKAVLKGKNVKEQLNILKENNLKLQNELQSILKSENLPNDYLQVHYKCSKCNDTGYIDGNMCSCFKKLLKDETYKQINKLSPLALSSFKTFNLDYYPSVSDNPHIVSPKKRMTNIFLYCKNYAQNFNLKSKNIIMQGATGLGKTHLSLSIANEVIKKGYGVIYASTPNVVSELEKETFRYKQSYSNTEQHLVNCDLLILDDLGTEFITSFSRAAVYNILNSRIMTSKPTILNTNLSLEELEKIYSERLVSRIMGDYDCLNFLGNDIREQKAKIRHI